MKKIIAIFLTLFIAIGITIPAFIDGVKRLVDTTTGTVDVFSSWYLYEL